MFEIISVELETHLFKVVWTACLPPGFAKVMTIQQHCLDLYEKMFYSNNYTTAATYVPYKSVNMNYQSTYSYCDHSIAYYM